MLRSYHLLYWNIESLAILKGETPPKPPLKTPIDNTETFNKFDATNWPDTVKRLDAVLTDIEHTVQSCDDAHLAANASRIAHIGTHNAYHTGQILEIRKLQGSWDPKKRNPIAITQ